MTIEQTSPAPAPAPAPAPVRRGRFMQRLFPILVIAGTALAVTIIWSLPNEIEGFYRSMIPFALIMLAGLLLGMWLVFFSGLRRGWLVALVVLVALGGTALGTIRRVHFDGNMFIRSVEFRWDPTQAELLQAERQRRASELPLPVAVDLDTPASDDWPAYRGPKRDGHASVPKLVREWDQTPPKLLWKQRCGGGYASFAIVNGRAITIEQVGGDEAIVCYDVDTGREIWEHRYPALFSESAGGDGPRATPTIHQGLVYSLGATGELVCLDAKTGQRKWGTNILTNNRNLTWGMCGSPLVVDDLVIVNPGAQTESAIGKAVRAYHRLTGEIVWETGSFNAGYSSPMLAELGGVSQVLIFDGKGLGGYLPRTGQELWRYEWVTQSDQGINVAQPVLLGQDRVLIASGYSRGAALLKVNRQQDQWSVETIWRTNIKTMRAKFSSPVAVGDYLYGLNDGIFECLDLRNGVAVWQDKRRAGRGRAYGHGQMLLVTDQSRPADDPARQQILMVTEANEILLIDPTPQGLREHARLVALSGEKTWNNPAIARGKLLVRNAYEIACYDLTRSE